MVHTNLESDEEGDGLHAVVASVHVVPHEQIVGVRRLAPDLEQLHEVVELTVDISTNRDGTLDCLYVALFGQDLLGLLAQDLHLNKRIEI